jgi:hypothetical protein
LTIRETLSNAQFDVMCSIDIHCKKQRNEHWRPTELITFAEIPFNLRSASRLITVQLCCIVLSKFSFVWLLGQGAS